MDSSIVIKVKYGKTLRRFNGRVDEAGRLVFSIDELREKILTLFKLSQEADLSLTYLDEDGDSVTLADDEDIYDIMRQSLNPLRITAKVNTEKGKTSGITAKVNTDEGKTSGITAKVNTEKGKTSHVRSSRDSDPMKITHRAYPPLPILKNTVSEVSEAVPEHVREILSKLYMDSVSSPQSPEIIQDFSKMLQACMVTACDSQIGTLSSTQSARLESAKSSFMAKEPEATAPNSKVVTVPNSVNQPIRFEKNMDTAIHSTAASENCFTNFNADHCCDGKEVVKKFSGSGLNAVAGKPAWEKIKAVTSSVLGSGDKEVKKQGEGWSSVSTGASSIPPFTFPNQNSASKTVNLRGNTSAGLFNQNVASKCPFAGMTAANELSVPYSHFGSRVHPFKRSYSQGGVSGIFHTGVCCDGCGVNPITGPRFKSKVKEDYDLCSICFAEMGSEADYMRLERPIPCHPHARKALYDFNAPVNPPQALRGMLKPNRSKLDSRFITDVTVIDGTMIPPSTPFTKIWRMRNNGTIVWPQGTQLVWIGGDRLSDSLSAGLQIPAEGLAVENELEVSVDFISPELPGRYISYWRMASPAGQKFGQRVWVLIQVDASRKDSTVNTNRWTFNLNLPPESSGLEGVESQAIDNEPIVVDGRLPIPELSNSATNLVEPLVVPLPTKDQDLHFPINDNLLVSGIVAPSEVVPATLSYPPVVISSAGPPIVASLASPTMPEVVASSVIGERDDVEQILLRELEEMGFKQVDLNKEILRTNEYDLEKSVDDLCGVCEWDPILEELQEMGFRDIEVNKKLLVKNNGSIKDVVMDLITGEKV